MHSSQSSIKKDIFFTKIDLHLHAGGRLITGLLFGTLDLSPYRLAVALQCAEMDLCAGLFLDFSGQRHAVSLALQKPLPHLCVMLLQER